MKTSKTKKLSDERFKKEEFKHLSKVRGGGVFCRCWCDLGNIVEKQAVKLQGGLGGY
jgi:hypothetical protein